MISIHRPLLGTTLGLLTFGLAALLTVACYAVVDQFDLSLRTRALAISTVAVVTADSMRVDFTDRFLRGFDDKRSRDFFQLWLPDGATLARSKSLENAELEHRVGAFDSPVFFYARFRPAVPGGRSAFHSNRNRPAG